jgi:hypothetical protein
MHSEECLSFLPRVLNHVPGLGRVAAQYQRNGVDFAQAYWTPPLTPCDAIHLESRQILDLRLLPLISITDHDNIEAGVALQATGDCRTTPVSIEWTVPFERTILHLGVHNIPRAVQASWFASMSAYTKRPATRVLLTLLSEFAAQPGVLLVLNHPFWLEEGVTQADHDYSLPVFLRSCAHWIHAFELNGTRPWRENAATLELARAHSRPVVSGGDRHGCEPAACLNLTNARTFGEFASEVRDGQSVVVVMPQYRESMAVRLFAAAWDVLRPYPEYAGRIRWADRCFYRGEDGVARPLSQIWQEHPPWILNPVAGLIQFMASAPVRPALRFVFGARAEVLP